MATLLLSLKGKFLILRSQHVTLGFSAKDDASSFGCLGSDLKATKSTEIIRDYAASMATAIKKWFLGTSLPKVDARKPPLLIVYCLVDDMIAQTIMFRKHNER